MRAFIFLSFFCGIFLKVIAQDTYYTQFQNSPLLISPTFAVFDNKIKAYFNYRQQYQLPDINFLSPSFTVIKPFMSQNKEFYRWGGVGLTARSESFSGNPAFSQNSISVAYAHNILIGYNSHLSFGTAIGYANFRMGTNSNFSTGRQYSDNYGFNSLIPTGEQSTAFAKDYFTASLGVHFLKEDQFRTPKYYVSFAVNHINQPNISLLRENVKLPIRLNLWAFYTFKLRNNIDLVPEIFYSFQSRHLLNIGAKLVYKINAENTKSIWSNASINVISRTTILQQTSVGVELNFPSFFIGSYYDFNISPSANVVLASGAYEIAIGYRKSLGKRKQFKDIPELMNADKEPSQSKSKGRESKKGFKQKEQFIKPK